MNEKAMLLASFAADALALGGHWVYNAAVIEKKYGRLDRYELPLGRSYHPTKDKGQFTHYGDQMLLLLEDIATTPGFDLSHFAQTWRNYFQTYDGYRDHATKDTLENFNNNLGDAHSGSPSKDLAGASRISPLIYYARQTDSDPRNAVELQTGMTHNHPDVIQSALFFTEITLAVLNGERPSEAIESAVKLSNYENIRIWTEAAKGSLAKETREAIAEFGQQCAAEAAFPGTIHLILKFENDLKEALVENVMAGGDSAARGMAVGMVLGAHVGMAGIPTHWLSEMRAAEHIMRLMEAIDALPKG